MNAEHIRTTSVLFCLTVFLLCGVSAAAQAGKPAGAQLPILAPPTRAFTPQPGVLTWFDTSLRPYSSSSEGCQVWLDTWRNFLNGIAHMPGVKGPTQTVSMLAPTSTVSPAREPAVICNYMVNLGNGQQQRTSVPLRAGCNSPAFRPDDLQSPHRCVPVNGAQPAAPAQAAAAVQKPQPASAAQASAASTDPLRRAQEILNSLQNSPGANPSDIANMLTALSQAQAAASQGNSGQTRATPQSTGGAPAAFNPNARPDASVLAPGLGSFRGADFVLTAYGCFRNQATVFCDFDVTKQAGMQVRAAQLWGSLGLADETGRVTTRRNAYFVASDGSRIPIATLSPTAVRLLMEFDGVSAQVSTVSLVNGRDQIPAVAIDLMDPGLPEGGLPPRQSVASAASIPPPAPVQGQTQPQPAATQQPDGGQKANGLDKVNQGADKVNQGVDKVNDIKNTGKSILDTLKRIPKK